MQRNYRFRLYPSAAQIEQLEAMLGAYCDLYNAALFERIDCYRKTGRSLNYYDQANQLKEVRLIDDRLAGYSFSGQQQLLRRVDKAFKAFYRRVKIRGEKAGFPRFQAKRRFDSIECRVGDGLTLKKTGHIGLTGIAGGIKVKWHRDIPLGAKLGHAILSRNGGVWQVSFLVTMPDLHLVPERPNPVGIDVGITSLIATSAGETVATPAWVKDSAAGLRRHQRRLARRHKGSQRWKKAKRDLMRYSRHVANQRKNFLHELSADIVSRYTHIAVEDLNVKGMSRGMLAKDILNASWGAFFQMITYKAESAGGYVEAVNPNGTSQLCSACGSTVQKKLSERKHCCPHCGYTADRDVNAAQNILVRSSFIGLGSSLRTQSTPDVGVRLVREAVCFS